jgi:hypothetical protein
MWVVQSALSQDPVKSRVVMYELPVATVTAST